MAAGTATAKDQTFHIVQNYEWQEQRAGTWTVHATEGKKEALSDENASNVEPAGDTHQTTDAAKILPFKSSAKQSESKIRTTPIGTTPAPTSDRQAQLIMHAHYTELVLSELKSIQQYSGQAMASVYANSLFHLIRQFRDLSPFDPYVEILMALYDALAFDNRWAEYSATQYEDAYKILKSYANQDIDNSKITKATLKLEQVGFETIPFGIDSALVENDDPEDEEKDQNLSE